MTELKDKIIKVLEDNLLPMTMLDIQGKLPVNMKFPTVHHALVELVVDGKVEYNYETPCKYRLSSKPAVRWLGGEDAEDAVKLPDQHQIDMGDLKAQIMGVLSEHGSHRTAADIMARLPEDWHWKYVNGALDQLVDRGKLRRTDRPPRLYRLAQETEEDLSLSVEEVKVGIAPQEEDELQEFARLVGELGDGLWHWLVEIPCRALFRGLNWILRRMVKLLQQRRS